MAWQPRKDRSFRKQADSEEEKQPAYVKPGSITSIESQKKNAKRISIFLDDKFAFGLHQDVLLQHSLHTGLYLGDSRIQELIQADALLRAKEASITYLGHRARTEHEVRTRLKEKKFSEEIVDKVITRLYELSYLDDEQFALNYTKSRFNFKGYGPQRIRAELRRLGIAATLIDKTLSEQLNQEDLQERALQEAQKRLKKLRNEENLTKKRRKLFQFLMRRGHTADIAREVIEQLEL